MRKIPVCEPTLDESDLEAVIEEFNSGWISGNGPRVAELEEIFASYVGVDYAVAVNTGTAAVHLMLLSIGLRPGDEVIVPTFTMAGSIFPLLYSGIRPVFIDADLQTWCINPELIERKITSRTKAIMAVHIYGFPCDMQKICQIANEYNLIVLEDSAEALGSSSESTKCGAFGLASAFSLFANKVVTSGEGGLILTNSQDVAQRARKLRNLSFPLIGERRYFHDEIGFNYRLSNLLAALGVSQMKRVEILIKNRIKNLDEYRKLLGGVTSVHFQPERINVINSAWMVGVRIERSPQDVKNIRNFLGQHGIETRPFFEPMHCQPALSDRANNLREFPVSVELSRSGFYLPSSSHLSQEDLVQVSNCLIEALSITSNNN